MPLPLSLIRTSLGKKYLSAATACLLSAFLLVHLAGNAVSFFGGAAYNAYAALLKALGPLLIIPEAVLALAFAVHVAMGVLLFIENRRARPCHYVANSRNKSVVSSSPMLYSGVVILIFILGHLIQFHPARDLPGVAALVKATLSQPAIGLWYLGSLAALGLHLRHGLWSLTQSCGITFPRHTTPLLYGQASGIFISAAFMLIVILSLLSDSFLR